MSFIAAYLLRPKERVTMKFKLFCGFTFILVLLVAAACFASPKAAAPNPSQDLTDSMASATVPSGIKGLNKHPSNPLIIENFPAGQNSVKIAAASPDVPQAVIQDSNHEFSPVVEGTQVVHDFIVQNKGNAPLIIEKVKTD